MELPQTPPDFPCEMFSTSGFITAAQFNEWLREEIHPDIHYIANSQIKPYARLAGGHLLYIPCEVLGSFDEMIAWLRAATRIL